MNKPLKITMVSVGSVLVGCVALGIIFGDDGKDREKPQPKATDVVVIESTSGGFVSPTPTPKTTQPVTSTPKPKATTKPATKPEVTTKPPPPPVYYANCAAVRAAGKAPLYRGDPGYRAALDRDGDGVACEK